MLSFELESRLSIWEKRAAEARARMAAIRATDCGKCSGPDCATAKACDFIGSDLEIEGAPMCKHIPELERRKREEQITQGRLYRLEVAGCRHLAVRRIVPAARGIPRPPAEMFATPADAAGANRIADAAEAFLASEDLLALVMVGGAGSGKSFVAAAIAATFSGRSVWVDARDADSIATWAGSHDAAGVESRARAADLVVIDELGTEGDGSDKWSPAGKIGGLMEHTINSGRRLVVTCNLLDGMSFADLIARYGPGLRSRLREWGDVVSAGSYDMRERVWQLRKEATR